MIKKAISHVLESIERIETEADARVASKYLAQVIDDLPKDASAQDSTVAKATTLQKKFEKKYPVTAGLIGELIEALAKSGA